ncbi:MAG: Do family serine endopeptidase [Pseudomonadales bacterium]|nr:Do family serine endopeptidase [Pseudomonadales bacterium]
MFVINKIVLGSLFLLLSVLSFDSSAQASLPDFTSLVTEASPAVVNITAIRKDPDTLQNNQEEVPEMLRRFFRDYQQRGTPRPATGSGFLISSDGYVLTNHHVVKGASEIIVALSDRRERVAELIGADPVSDLALLKIDAADLPVVSIGSSESLKVGEWVMAIGSPFGFELSVTAGIVSAKGRSLPDDLGNYVPFIQTDVAINPGNSGGPLFNLDGKVVGINSQIFTRSGGFMGLSFAIPIDVAMEVVAQLKDKGSVSRGWLGVQIQRVDRDLAESFGLDRAAGALVTRVFADSPAAAAGVREGDIIVEFGGRGIDLSSDLPHVVGRFKAGSETHLLVERGGESVKLAVKVGELDADGMSLASTEARSESTRNRLGLEVRAMSSEEKIALDAPQGVLVIKVEQGPGKSANLTAGDVITTINSQWVDSVTDFNTVMSTLPVGVALPVRIIRAKQPQFIAIKIDS